ncbi:MAG: bifunctional demethylmenaquinone methyltransferase/2-methoxy-6-polyprenyl-1,4-benzoquinol methylase UbiE [Actinomycetota bacterium]
MESKEVAELFDDISKSYDRANRLLSFDAERYWRKRFAGLVRRRDRVLLDACCGTGSSTYSLWRATGKKGKVYGIDFSKKMLDMAREKYASHKESLLFFFSDVTRLDFGDDFFDVVAVAFGIRNINYREEALAEFYRVAKPGGRLICMEFGFPRQRLFSHVYGFYLEHVLTNIGGFISKKKVAYRHLAESIRRFPQVEDFKRLLGRSGWKDPKVISLSFGICNIYTAFKD